MTGSSVSGVIAHSRRNGVDYQMGGVLVVGGILGTLAGAAVFRVLQQLGQIDTVINIVYVLLLGSIGGLMARESLASVRAMRRARRCRPRSGATIRWSPTCRCAGASTVRASTSRRSRR